MSAVCFTIFYFWYWKYVPLTPMNNVAGLVAFALLGFLGNVADRVSNAAAELLDHIDRLCKLLDDSK